MSESGAGRRAAGALVRRGLQSVAAANLGPAGARAVDVALESEGVRRTGRRAVIAALVIPLVVLIMVGQFISAGGMMASRANADTVSCGPGVAVPSTAVLDQGTVDGVNALKGLYEQAGSETGVSWAALAAIDYRESTNDPNRSAISGEVLGTANPDGKGTMGSKLESLVHAAQSFKDLASGVYGVQVTPETGGPQIQQAFVAYNRGYIYQRANQPPETSPYVMNQYDEAHRDMTFPSIPGEPLAGRQEVGRYGAFTLFERLGGSAAGGGACPTGAISGEARDLLANPNVEMSPGHRADLESGAIDPRIIGALSWMARNHRIVITSLKSDHSPCAGGKGAELDGGGCRAGLSNHGYGRAADVGAVDGVAVINQPPGAREIVDGILAEPGHLGLTELGQPFYDRTVDAVYVFTADHHDHIHIGIDA